MSADILNGPWKPKAQPKPWRPPAITMLAGGLSEAFSVDDRSHIHPDLDAEFATQIEFAAAVVKQLAERAKSLKRVHEQISFANMQDILETRAGMIRAEIGDHD